MTKQTSKHTKLLVAAAASGIAFAFAVAVPVTPDFGGGLVAKAAFARGGADDGAGHDAGDDRGRGGKGADDGPNHT